MADARSEPDFIRSFATLCLSMVFVYLIAAAGGSVTETGPESWYQSLIKPALTPPNIVFPVVWNILFFMMGLSAWLVWRAAGGLFEAGRALALFGIQLGLNLSWSVVFFGLRSPGGAAVEILFLLAAIAATIATFWPISRLAAWLLVPYFLWVTFAAYLTVSVWVLNG